MRQPTSQSEDDRRALYEDAKLIVAAHRDPKLIGFLKDHKDFFEGYFKSHHIVAVAVVFTVEAFVGCPDACKLNDRENAYRSLKATGNAGAEADAAEGLVGNEEENNDDRSRVRAQSFATLRKVFDPKNIPARASQRQFIMLLSRAIGGTYEQRLQLEKMVKPPICTWVTEEDADGRPVRRITGEKDWRINRNGIGKWLFARHGFKVEWSVINRALRNIRKFYDRLTESDEGKDLTP